MRITTFNQIFGMLAVSPNTTLSVFGKEVWEERFGEGRRRRTEKPAMRPAGLRPLPLSTLLLNEKTRATPVGQGRGDMMPIS